MFPRPYPDCGMYPGGGFPGCPLAGYNIPGRCTTICTTTRQSRKQAGIVARIRLTDLILEYPIRIPIPSCSSRCPPPSPPTPECILGGGCLPPPLAGYINPGRSTSKQATGQAGICTTRNIPTRIRLTDLNQSSIRLEYQAVSPRPPPRMFPPSIWNVSLRGGCMAPPCRDTLFQIAINTRVLRLNSTRQDDRSKHPGHRPESSGTQLFPPDDPPRLWNVSQRGAPGSPLAGYIITTKHARKPSGAISEKQPRH